jgi:hypothetical protein
MQKEIKLIHMVLANKILVAAALSKQSNPISQHTRIETRRSAVLEKNR